MISLADLRDLRRRIVTSAIVGLQMVGVLAYILWQGFYDHCLPGFLQRLIPKPKDLWGS